MRYWARLPLSGVGATQSSVRSVRAIRAANDFFADKFDLAIREVNSVPSLASLLPALLRATR